MMQPNAKSKNSVFRWAQNKVNHLNALRIDDTPFKFVFFFYYHFCLFLIMSSKCLFFSFFLFSAVYHWPFLAEIG